MNLEGLQQKINKYNKKHSTNWAILLETTTDVFIVDKEDNTKSPKWWPNNATAETIKKACELVPSVEEEKLSTIELNFNSKSALNHSAKFFVTKRQYMAILALIEHELKYGK